MLTLFSLNEFLFIASVCILLHNLSIAVSSLQGLIQLSGECVWSLGFSSLKGF
jgi:hypothetical protein